MRNHDCSHTVDKAIFIVPLPVACFFEGLEWLGAAPVTQLGKSSFGRYERFPPIMVPSARKLSAPFLKTITAEMKQFYRETRSSIIRWNMIIEGYFLFQMFKYLKSFTHHTVNQAEPPNNYWRPRLIAVVTLDDDLSSNHLLSFSGFIYLIRHDIILNTET